MEELNNLIEMEKPRGIKITNVDKQKQCNIADVSNCADELEPIIGNITATAFTTPNDHGIVTVELRYGHYKMKGWKKGDKLELKKI